MTVQQTPKNTFQNPFTVMERVGHVSYKLLLLDGCEFRHTFHIDRWKTHLGPEAVPNTNP